MAEGPHGVVASVFMAPAFYVAALTYCFRAIFDRAGDPDNSAICQPGGNLGNADDNLESAAPPVAAAVEATGEPVARCTGIESLFVMHLLDQIA